MHPESIRGHCWGFPSQITGAGVERLQPRFYFVPGWICSTGLYVIRGMRPVCWAATKGSQSVCREYACPVFRSSAQRHHCKAFLLPAALLRREPVPPHHSVPLLLQQHQPGVSLQALLLRLLILLVEPLTLSPFTVSDHTGVVVAPTNAVLR